VTEPVVVPIQPTGKPLEPSPATGDPGAGATTTATAPGVQVSEPPVSEKPARPRDPRPPKPTKPPKPTVVAGPGTLNIIGPTGSDIFVDGKRVGEGMVGKLVASAGSHTVEVRGENGETAKQRVTVKAGELTKVSIPNFDSK
jgi:hypothetical protein